jgi:hypothetical protein
MDLGSLDKTMTDIEVVNGVYVVLAAAFTGQAGYIGARYFRRRSTHLYHWKHVGVAAIGGVLVGVGLVFATLARFDILPWYRLVILTGFLTMNAAMAMLYRQNSEEGA